MVETVKVVNLFLELDLHAVDWLFYHMINFVGTSRPLWNFIEVRLEIYRRSVGMTF